MVDLDALDPYRVLGVGRSATVKQIRAAYLDGVRRVHPDSGGSAEDFVVLRSAYELLQDPERRAAWDAAHRASTTDSFADLYRHAVERPAEPIHIEHWLGLPSLLHGTVEQVSVRRRDPQGAWEVVEVRMIVAEGSRDGTQITLTGAGHADRNGRGDVIVTLRMTLDPRVSLAGHDVRVQVPVTYAELVLGGEIVWRIPSLEQTVRIPVPAGTPDGWEIRLPEQGLLRADGTRGALFATLQLTIPRVTSEIEAELLRTLREIRPGSDLRN